MLAWIDELSPLPPARAALGPGSEAPGLVAAGGSVHPARLQEAYSQGHPPSRQGRPLRLYYGSQVAISPPTFVIFVNDIELVHFSYERYLENQFRAYFPFTGTPIHFVFRASDRKGDKD